VGVARRPILPSVDQRFFSLRRSTCPLPMTVAVQHVHAGFRAPAYAQLSMHCRALGSCSCRSRSGGEEGGSGRGGREYLDELAMKRSHTACVAILEIAGLHGSSIASGKGRHSTTKSHAKQESARDWARRETLQATQVMAGAAAPSR
jgi:hypothetical protein